MIYLGDILQSITVGDKTVQQILTEIKETVTNGQSEINSTAQSAKDDINSTASTATSEINTTVTNAKTDINNTSSTAITNINNTADSGIERINNQIETKDWYSKAEVDEKVKNAGGVVVSATAPSNTSALWIDSGNGNIAKFYNGSAWTVVPSVWG